MNISYYKLEDKIIREINDAIEPKDWNEKLDWVNIRIESRDEVGVFFQKWDILDQHKQKFIEYPEQYSFSNSVKNAIILNLPISNSKDIYQVDYISIIKQNKLIITVTPSLSDIFNERNISTYTPKKFPSLANFIFYILGVKILAQSNTNMSASRNYLKEIEQKLINDPEEISLNELMSTERNINQLSDIVEDQYVGFEILSSISSNTLKQEDLLQSNKLTNGFKPLDKAMQRLEKKAESLRLQYMLYQQEKSTKKINLLTIIQAIFVPLTFIAGVYGMNFINMPELEWKLGYLFVWIVFAALGSGLLIYFYKKGWFE